MKYSPSHRLPISAALSLAAHLYLLALLPGPTPPPGRPFPLAVRLPPPTAKTPPVPPARPIPPAGPSSRPRPATAVATAPLLTAPAPSAAPIEPRGADAPTLRLDRESLYASARRIAREDNPPPPAPPPALPRTVEAAVALATAKDTVIELRGPAGEHIVRTRNRRCVTPLQQPVFMGGGNPITLCEVTKG